MRDSVRATIHVTAAARGLKQLERILIVGRARWYFLIDRDDAVHRTTHKVAESVWAGSVDPELPHRDADGVLLASVGLSLDEGVPSAIYEISVYPLAATKHGKGRPISPISPTVADNLCSAIRERLNRQKVQRLGRIEERPCSELKAAIIAGRYTGWVYDDLLGLERQAMYRPSGGLRSER